MVRLRSGRFDWTVQVEYPPPLTEGGARRRVQEKAVRMTLEFLQINIAEVDPGTGSQFWLGVERSK